MSTISDPVLSAPHGPLPEDRYRLLFERALDAVYTLDMEGTFLDINQTGTELLGYTRKELRGMNFFDLIPDEQSGPAVSKLRDPAHYDLYRDPLEFRVRGKSGRIVWIETKAKVLMQDGIPSAIQGIAVDITEKKLAIEALADREAQYRSIFEAASDAFLIFDPKGRLAALNPAACALYGFDESRILGKRGEEVAPRRFHTEFRDFLRKVNADGRYFAESVHTTFHGGTIHVEIRGTRFNYQGNPHVLATVRDITDRVRLTADLLRQKEAMEDKSRHLEETNTALRVLIRQREEDREELSASIMANVRELVLPYLETLKDSLSAERDLRLLETATSNLDAVASPFARKLARSFHHLTPTEIRVANLVRHGRSSKEIASILGLSKSTIDFHRNNIRRKLGLSGRKQNLRTQLQVIQGSGTP